MQSFAQYLTLKFSHYNLRRVPRFNNINSQGFTFIETIVVMTLLGIAAVTIIKLQGTVFYGKSDNKDLQVGVMLMQECAEQVIAVRRNAGYTAVNTSTCSALGNYGGYTAPIVTVTADNTGTACPTGGTCNKVVITLSKNGSKLTPVTLELVDY